MKPLFLNLFGPPGTGKSTVGFTAPPPFFYGRFDRRADTIIKSVRQQFGESSVIEKVFVPELGDSLKSLADGYLAGVEELAWAAIPAHEGPFFIAGGDRRGDPGGARPSRPSVRARGPDRWLERRPHRPGLRRLRCAALFQRP